MGRRVEKLELKDDDIVITSEQLPYEDSEDLLPEVAQLLAGALSELAALVGDGGVKGEEDIIRLLPAIGPAAAQLGGGKLKRLVPKILATTVVAMSIDGELQNLHLMKKEDRATCFDARPDLYFRVLWHAGKTTFARYFPGGMRRPAKPAAPKAE